MKRIAAIAVCYVVSFAALQYGSITHGQTDEGWITLLQDQTIGDWDKVGDANWTTTDDGLVADRLIGKDPAYLVSKTSYKDFQIRAEFWADDAANSGIFIRCDTNKTIDSKVCYEVNIFDKRPDPSYGTGAIVDVAKVNPMPKAAGKWNTYEVTAKGTHLIVVLNGEKTADVENSQHAEGPIALQYGSGMIKFRKVQIRPL
ncbi:3-keto-disaccharide hydrolase [Rhodopseudomonas sp. P2A-2r]|uniref:3-keto-disaccharide hydrolase n=1 Tax=unclassified Rhodopseudomonas TaxID=2638247 RepID=UPI0022347EA9|nr:DUF1080 domain-containing protein [Rhodopseudomonas sp. P2A-2r]UZE52380.1 DUF1080 domain-containing protein [Rhodopseudomonas sp. P2A-2r]